MIVYCSYKHETQKICDEAVDGCLAALKFIPDWFVTNKMLQKSDNALFANGDILFYNEDFDKVTIIFNERHILAVDLHGINLDKDENFYEEGFDNIAHVRLLACRSKKHEALKKR